MGETEAATTGVSITELEEFVPMMCKALNDPKRILILLILGEAPHTVSELVSLIGAPQANVSQHLAVLRDRGIIEAQREGSNVWYRLRYPEILDALSVLREIFRAELRRKGAIIPQPDGWPDHWAAS
ncbi:transcriptional regulator, ArsR family [Acidimicrobium ferrooxidans DSM 10331]|uniref:Transcriptional regulator, ArsR family n=1 Tax=Acidimicrobium ferrooxidans (strain DSM 10331 / JCM 15462 / NBRC 103882 / ICP) TaxID=525909 RepID=C7M2N3_ACIFD|nr:metalloregulator ArsR/SmtB family transcription factor [Acidimicrobium ferrooxidans]ACU53277.1 transcriptional regulator, ArsR family [Acidimicrobium ferrooxidans DSM 10331]